MHIENFGFLDIETTGHDPLLQQPDGQLVTWHEIIDLALIVTNQKLKILGKFDQKVIVKHPERCIPNIINNFPERLAMGEWDTAKDLKETLQSLLCFVSGFGKIIIVGQNPSFDIAFLKVALCHCGHTNDHWDKYFHYAPLDTKSMAVQALLGPDDNYDPSSFSLRNSLLSERLGIESEPIPHKAVNGAMQSYNVFKALRNLKEQKGKIQ